MNPFLLGKPRPIVVGHRGVPARHQENTLAGFRHAISLGIPAVELDVQLTKDRRAVVLHDDDLRRLTGDSRRIFDLTWDQASRLRIRRELPMGIDVHGAPVTIRYDHEEPIPLLEEVLAEVSDKLALNIELKMTPAGWWQTEIARVVAKVIADARVEHRVIVTSFDPRKLRATFDAYPELLTGYCFSDNMLNFARPLLGRLPLGSRPPADSHLQCNARHLLSRIVDSNMFGGVMRTRVVGAEHTIVSSQTVSRLHDKGISVGTHTIFPIGSTTGKAISPTGHETAEIERLVALGIDWIESDDPERLQNLLG
ncbi:MAG: glycerophosphodiester phosphodiesterase [Myxococcota bacterium]|nr:glycerophosphodiester phosphodiesterase [Deltaproteobacteria bacterium]MDQ3341578.1 glycerophosphodiester phosphodiesterase [Myxococcota bacterium]